MSEEKCIEINGGNDFIDSTDERLYRFIFDKMRDAVQSANPLINDGLDRLAHRLASQVPREELYRSIHTKLTRIQRDRALQQDAQDAQDFRAAAAGLL